MRINLLPDRYKPQPQARLGNIMIMLIAAAALAVLGYFDYNAFTTNQRLNEETVRYERMILSYQQELALAQEQEKLFAQVDQIHQEVTKIRELYPANYLFLCDITNAISEDVWLERIEIGNGYAINVEGKSLYFPQIGDFLDKASGLFAKASLQDVSKQKTEKGPTSYSFKLELITGRSPIEYGQN